MKLPPTEPQDGPKGPPNRPRFLFYSSLIVVLFLTLVVCRWLLGDKIAYPMFEIRGLDPHGYFTQLRSLYFDHDLNILSELVATYGWDWEPHFGLNPEGDPANQWVIGPALLWLPFYAMGHLWVLILNRFSPLYPVSGFEFPFMAAVGFGTMVYGVIGLILSFRLAVRYAPPSRSFSGTLCVWLCSPFIFYLLILPAMAHVHSMFTVALFLYYGVRSWGGKTLSQWCVLGLLGGLMTISRLDSGAYLILAGVDFGVWLKSAGRGEVPLAGRAVKRASCFVLGLFIMLTPQMLAWNYYYGNPFGVSYMERFDTPFNLLGPDLWTLFFSSYAGIFPHSPILAFSFIGLFFWKPGEEGFKTGAVASFILVLWFTSSYTLGMGNTFGYRYMVQSTPLMIVGLACFYSFISRHKRLVMPVALISVLMVCWGLLFLLQSSMGLVPPNRPLTWDQIFYDKWRMLLDLWM